MEYKLEVNACVLNVFSILYYCMEYKLEVNVGVLVEFVVYYCMNRL